MTNTGLSADTQAILTFESNKKSTGTAFLFWFFLGGFGGHRFYLERTGSAVTQLILAILGWTTVWFVVGLVFLVPLGIWLLIDAFSLSGMVQSYNNALMTRLNAYQSGPAPISTVDELAKYAALRDSGAITAEEYEAQKRRLIGEAPVAGSVSEIAATA